MLPTSTIWALSPEYLQALYDLGLRARADQSSLERLSETLQAAQQPHRAHSDAGGIQEGAAVTIIPIVGVLMPRSTWWMKYVGGTSLKAVTAMLDEAADDESVSHIVLEIDSPGGQVAGVQALANRIREIAAGGKRVTAWISGSGASGAYWIASSAQRVVIGDRTTMVGSIGVVAHHVDVSKHEESLGLKTTEITAGRYKRIASEYGPLSDEGRATLQDQVDEIYRVFVDSVATNRGVTVERVLSNMADGKVFIGDQAVAAGLVDAVASLEDVVRNSEASEPGAGSRAARAAVYGTSTSGAGAHVDDQAPKPEASSRAPVRTSGPTCGAFFEAHQGFQRVLELRYGYEFDELPKQTVKRLTLGLAVALDGVDLQADELDAMGRRCVVQAAREAANRLRSDGHEPTGTVRPSH